MAEFRLSFTKAHRHAYFYGGNCLVSASPVQGINRRVQIISPRLSQTLQLPHCMEGRVFGARQAIGHSTSYDEREYVYRSEEGRNDRSPGNNEIDCYRAYATG